MTTDTAVTVMPATGSMLLDQYAADNGHTIIDQQHVHRVYRDPRTTASHLILGAAALASAGALVGITTQRYLTLAHALTVLAGLLVFSLLFVHRAPARTLRNWIYNNPDDTV